MEKLEFKTIKNFFEGDAEFNHPYWGYFGENFLVASTSHRLISSMAGKSTGLDRFESLFKFTDFSSEYDSNALFQKLLNDPSSALVVDYVVRKDNSAVDGFVDEKIIVLSSSKELLKDSFSYIKDNYINKYSQSIDLRSFRPDQINFRIKTLLVDKKCVLDSIVFNNKREVYKMEDFLNTIVDAYADDEKELTNLSKEDKKPAPLVEEFLEA